MSLETDPEKPTINQDLQILIEPSTNSTACFDYYSNSSGDYSAMPDTETSTMGK
jgi:hypothetical protein